MGHTVGHKRRAIVAAAVLGSWVKRGAHVVAEVDVRALQQGHDAGQPHATAQLRKQAKPP